MINGLDLFSGIGGMSIALNEWVRPVAYCEIDPYCRGVLLSRMLTDEIYEAAIWDDIKTFNTDCKCAGIDIIYGGFPCQDISIAGHGKGLEGERSGLFFEIVRVAKEIKPKFIFLENVPAITARGGLDVVRTITEMGYDSRWCVISAASVGAVHRRERWFLLAHANDNGTSASQNRKSPGKRTISGRQRAQEQTQSIGEVERTGGISSDVADTRCECERGENKPEWPSLHFTGCPRSWEVEPEVGRLVDGLPLRVEQLRAYGNAVVPLQAKEAFKILMGLK